MVRGHKMNFFKKVAAFFAFKKVTEKTGVQYSAKKIAKKIVFTRSEKEILKSLMK